MKNNFDSLLFKAGRRVLKAWQPDNAELTVGPQKDSLQQKLAFEPFKTQFPDQNTQSRSIEGLIFHTLGTHKKDIRYLSGTMQRALLHV